MRHANRFPFTTLRLAAAGVLTAASLAACGSGTTSGGSGGSSGSGSASAFASGATVVHANAVDTMDPIQSVQAEVDTETDLLYDPLVTYNTKGDVVGMLAKTFTIAPDASSVSFTLRPGVKFHDGSTLTSADVAYTLDRDKTVGAGVANYLADYKSTTLTGPNALTIHLKTPNALFLGMLSKIYIVNAAEVTKNGGSDNGQAWLATHDAGTGPYEVGSAASMNNIVLNRFPGYWDYDATRPVTMKINRVDQSSTEAADLRSGTADLATKLTSADASDIGKGGNGLTTAWITSGLTEYMFFSTRSGPTANVLVRRALQDAYDYNGGLAHVWDGKGALLHGFLPPTLSCLADLPTPSQNLTEAKALLKQAGYSGGLTLTMRYQPQLSEFTQEATLFQSNLKQIGVTLKLVPITFSEYLSDLSKPTTIPQISLIGDVPRFPDTTIYLNYAYNGASVGTNYSGLDNSQVNSLLDKAEVTPSPAARCALDEQAEKIIYDQATAVNMYTYQQPVSYRDGLTGIVASPNANPITLSTVRVGG